MDATDVPFVVGVDSGGTFTDAVVVRGGTVGVGKALTTPADLSAGVLAAVEQAAVDLGVPLATALAGCAYVAVGTTVGLNALLTGQGARVALLTTEGFEDTLAIARGTKTVGLDEEQVHDPLAWAKPEPLVPPERIVGVLERVDRAGDVVLALDAEAAAAAVERVAATGPEAVAISLLWAFRNPAHERRLADLVRDRLPGTHVTAASDLVPRLGEYERTTTAVLDAYVAPVVAAYLDGLEGRLRALGCTAPLLVLKSSGGVQRADRVRRRPVDTVRSGPSGGLGAAAALGRRLGHRDVITSDVGGTSFDVGLVVDGEPQLARKALIERYAVALPLVDVESIGTGGGSIAWVDPHTGGLRVGPRSAGSSPGPACYGRGGTEATLTDAAVVLGYLDRLGGDLRLDREAAAKAVTAAVADPLGLTAVEAAEAVVRVSCAQMADLVRRVTVRRGHDPQRFALYAFGGAAPQYAGRYAAELGVPEVVIPPFAAVFSAFGAAASDVRTSAERDVQAAFPPDPAELSAVLADLEAAARAELDDTSAAGAVVTRSAGLRFRRQVHEVRVPLPARVDAGALDGVLAGFKARYEQLYGAGTAGDAGVELVGVRVDVTVPVATPVPDLATTGPAPAPTTRPVWFDGERHDCPVHDGALLPAGAEVAGPALVELRTTCVVVRPGHRLRVDGVGAMVLSTGAGS